MTIESPRTNGWTAFWNRGGFWRAVLAAVVYIAIYLGAGFLVGRLFGDQIDVDDLLGTPQSVFFGLMVPLIIGSIVLVVFIASVGWFRPLFSRQPIKGKWWMWVAPVLVAVAIVLRLFGIDYGSYKPSVVALVLITGIFIGFAEETLTRGIVVKMLRDSGKSEWVVMVLSSLVFALLHASNLFSMPLLTVLPTIGFTFAFGICMYLTLRVTGNLIWPIILHALYDPTLFLASGGIDHVPAGGQSALLVLAGPANIVYIVIAVVALIFVRGRVPNTAPLSV